MSCSARSPVSDQTEKFDSEGVEGDGEWEEDLRVPCFSFSPKESCSEDESSDEGRELGEMDRRGIEEEDSGGGSVEEMMAVVSG